MANLGFAAKRILAFLRSLIVCDILYDLKFKTSAFFYKEDKVKNKKCEIFCEIKNLNRIIKNKFCFYFNFIRYYFYCLIQNKIKLD